MANEFDIDKMKNNDVDKNSLDKKLSAFEEEKKDVSNAVNQAVDSDDEKTAEKVEQPAEDPEEKKLSKADMAKLIAARLSENDADEQPSQSSQNTGTAAKTAVATEERTEAKADPKPEKTENKKKEKKSVKKKEKDEPKRSVMGLVLGFFGGLVAVAVLAFYVGGLVMTSGKFLPGTTINGKDVSSMTASQAAMIFKNDDATDSLSFYRIDGTVVEISYSDIDFELHTEERIQELLDSKNSALWFVSLIKPESYKEDLDAPTYNEEKLKEKLSSIEWGDKEPVDAYITSKGSEFVIIPEEDGQKVDVETLFEYTKKQISEGNNEIQIAGANSTVKAQVVSSDLTDELERMNKLADMVITIDFDYTTEELKGTDIANWITYNEDGTYDVDETKVRGYVEQLASKYDTYNTERKFNATLQGEITVPTSDDAYYGWWIYKDETVELLVELIKKGESVTTDPVYYYTENADGSKGYVFTGVEEARTAEDDIGDTYVEIDLTAQTLWHYVDGKVVHTCGIVSGQLNPSARKTLPGVYKVWFKAKNYTMKSSNSAGESWESECAYWTRVSIVGIGLHDSQWRGNNVGGQIYKTNGSHGCINMTLADAKYIYENVEYGTPVVMYY